MSQLVNSQLSPVNLFLDSRQANFLSEEGSQATFDLAGNDLELMHSEARTAAVSLYQFHAANTIYNIDNTCNSLEIYTQYTDAGGNLQSGTSTVITIPVGYYNIKNLLSILNQEIFLTYPTTQPTDTNVSYYPGFGDPYTPNFETPAIAIDNQITGSCAGSYLNNSVTFKTVDSTFSKTNKVKFFSPPLDKLNATGAAPSNSKHFYGGFYIITNTYSGLMEKLGFPNVKSSILPVKITNATSGTTKGFGIQLALTSYNSSSNTATYTVANPTANIYVDDSQIFDWTGGGSTQTGTNMTYRKVCALQAYSWVDLDTPRSIYVSIDSIITRNRCSSSKFPYGTIFARIPTASISGSATGFGQIILYEPHVAHEIYVPGLNLDQLTIRLYDENGNSINWNGGHWAMTLSITHNIDVGSAGFEDASLGRTFRPYLKGTDHDALHTKTEFTHKRMRK